MVYHLIVAVSGIALLLYGWLWVQERANRHECKDKTNEALCVMGADCHGCTRAGDAKIESRNSDDMKVYFEPNDQIGPRL